MKKLVIPKYSSHAIFCLIFLGLMAFGYSLREYEINDVKDIELFANSCYLEDGRRDWFTDKGAPSTCLVHTVTETKGSWITAITLTVVKDIADSHYKNMPSGSAWAELAKVSVEGIEEKDWPLFLYKYNPFLESTHSSNIAFSCIPQMKQGKYCDLFASR